MSIDVASLMEPLSADAPCGEDLEYAPEYLELQAAAAGKPEQQVGESIVAAEPPDWRDVARRATDLLARTRDLRLACHLTRALLHTEGVGGLRDGLAVVSAYLDRFWDEVYPRLDAEDGFDPAIRANAVATLSHVGRVVKPLRDAPLVVSRVAGPISARTIAIASGAEASEGGDERKSASPAEIEGAFLDCDLAQLRFVADAASQAHELALAIEASVASRIGNARGADMGPLAKALGEIRKVLAHWLAQREASADAAEPDAAEDGAGASTEAESAPAPRPSRSGFRSREDVVRGLEEMCRYFMQHEPSSPVPILLTRARRWVSMDFIEVLRDMVPEAAQEAERLRGAANAD
ncbi:MAG: type VI secretion system protein TssA [Rhodocyclaceae bacterium]